MEALKNLVRKPNLREIDATSTFRRRIRARLTRNSFSKQFYTMKTPPTGPTVLDFGPYINKFHLWSLFFGATIIGLGFYSSVLVTLTRKETFTRNYALIDKKYGEKHRQAFGEDAKINKYGYPDMGNNIFADLLPYRDWVKMNNAQRMHQSGNEYGLVFLPNAFIAALSYPRLAAGLTAFYAINRINHINGYTGPRGYNAALLHEELMRMDIIFVLMAAFASGLRITGVFNPFWRVVSPRMASLLRWKKK